MVKPNLYAQLNEEQKKISLYIYGDIVSEGWRWGDDEVSSHVILEHLQNENIEFIDVFINSYGGEVFEGLTIYSILKRHKAKVNVVVDGIAASIASVIALAGDSLTLYRHSMMMVHNAWTIAWGNANDFRKTAEDMDKIMDSVNEVYMNKFTGTKEELQKLLDEETYLNASDCLVYGFADRVVDEDNHTSAQMKMIWNMVNKSKSKPQEAVVQTNESLNSDEEGLEARIIAVLNKSLGMKVGEENEANLEINEPKKPNNRFFRNGGNKV